MIIEADETTVISNMPVGSVTEMSIDQDGLKHLMKTLTNLYNDPMLAVIREYFANGLDSHVMAGQTDPVLVSLPNSYNKMFVVQDFGVGMSVDDIHNIYSKYGASTKRGSNDQIGAYGLGAKSALAIANQFTLVSIKDGVKATVLVQKAESGVNTMSVVSVLDTDDANGVTVSIPVDDTYSFNSKAREFFRFVDPGLVLVDGYAPASIFSSATALDNITVPNAEVYIDLDQSYGTSYVIMGQVSYALTGRNISDAAERLNLSLSYELRNMPVYFKVGIGDVDLTPNREGLRFTDKTNALIDALVSGYIASVKVTAQEELDAIDDRFKTYEVAERWEERLGDTMQWRGEDILKEIGTEKPSSTIKRTTWDKSSHGSTYSVGLTTRNGYRKVIVTGQPFDKYRRMSNYITDYMGMMDITGGITFYFREALDELDTAWVTENPNITLENFDDMIQRVRDHRKAERAAAKALLPKGQQQRVGKIEYPVLDLDDNSISRTPYDELPADSYYLHANDLVNWTGYKSLFEGSYASDPYTNRLKLIVGDGATVIFIAKNRSLESFKARTKDVHGLRSIREAFPDVQERINELMTDDVHRARNKRVQHTANRYLARLDSELIAEILDDEVRELLAPADPALLEKAETAVQLYQAVARFGFTDVSITFPEMTEAFEEVDTAAKYPLADLLGSFPSVAAKRHMISYMNMIYTDQLTLVDA